VNRVEINRSAKADILRVASYYESAKEGLGDKFLDRVQELINRIALNPGGYAKVIGEARKAELRQFPYSLWFKVEAHVLVIGCLHHRRDKVLARERAFGIFPMPDPK
jgi:hypothetical protein